MSGTSESNDELVSGRLNLANHQTTIWAVNTFTTPGPFGLGPDLIVDYSGSIIFLAEVAKSSDEEGEFRPRNPVDAIVGIGWSAEFEGKSGGTGVTGIGGTVGGLGVRGQGGQGAAGVQGAGGNSNLITVTGTGVFGPGGLILEANPDGVLPGPGVVGISDNAESMSTPAFADIGGVGVFGKGADAKQTIAPGGGPTSLPGPPTEPSAGVIGRGGVSSEPRVPPAAGVVGIAGVRGTAGIRPRPTLAESGDAGVFGIGATGIRGVGDSGPGVQGVSETDRGGVFFSQDVAQAQLVPKSVPMTMPQGSSVAPTGISKAELERGAVPLPRSGRGGDLMTLMDDKRICTLWFLREGRG